MPEWVTAEWTARRARAAQRQGKPQGPEGSLGKLAASNVARAAARVHTQMTGTEALLTGRFEHTGTGQNLRIKVGAGHALQQSFGAAQWRIVFGVEMFGHK